MSASQSISRRQSAHALRAEPSMEVANDPPALRAVVEARRTFRHSRSLGHQLTQCSFAASIALTAAKATLKARQSRPCAELSSAPEMMFVLLHCPHSMVSFRPKRTRSGCSDVLFGHDAAVTPQERNRNIPDCGFRGNVVTVLSAFDPFRTQRVSAFEPLGTLAT